MPDATGAADVLTIGTATAADWAVVREWAADEGWNPGERDITAFFAQDPEGFFLGRIDGEPVSAVSVVNYGTDYAFLGFYLVRPRWRGTGLGLATWKAGIAHAGSRTIGLDGVPDRQGDYRRSGFELAYRSARFVGVPRLPGADGTVRTATAADTAALHRYDSGCMPADRPRFLGAWLAEPGHHTVVREQSGVLTGFGTVRPARDSLRVGPLFADSAEAAGQLLAGLGEFAAGRPLAIDVPLTNAVAVELAESAGLTPSFDTARMYTGPVRAHRQDRVFGATSLELG
ncbi:GNAT family N-acetyltransferase [Nocardia sp. NPDC005978]|uniref:GNAT family N-acetyltransferase n=1 Tax=Nocardia sp. NPDC005978 TaxID=3156725 RepID=UPI0033A9A854